MYLSCEGLSIFKEIINTILKLSGSDKEYDDFFELYEAGDYIRVVPTDPENTRAAEILSKVNDIFYVSD